MSEHWYRVYDDLINDPKWLQLDHSSRSTLVELWCIASSEKASSGFLPPIEELAIRLRTRPQWLKKRILKLQQLGLIDCDEKGLRPHNWSKRQFQGGRIDPTNAERQKRYRDRHSNVSNVTRNAPDTDSEVEKGNIPLGNISRSLPAERVTCNAAEAAASGGSLEGSPPAAAAEAERPAPPSEEDRARVAAALENFRRGCVLPNGQDDAPVH